MKQRSQTGRVRFLAAVLLCAVFALTLAQPIQAHVRVVRHRVLGSGYVVWYRTVGYVCGVGHHSHVRHLHGGTCCRYAGVYYFHPAYGRHRHFGAGFSVGVVF